MECLAVVKAISHFEAYLIGNILQLYITDHSALQYLQSSCHLNGRLTRALQLQHYHFTIHHRKGKMHQNADGLSRQAWVFKHPTRTLELQVGEMSGLNSDMNS